MARCRAARINRSNPARRFARIMGFDRVEAAKVDWGRLAIALGLTANPLLHKRLVCLATPPPRGHRSCAWKCAAEPGVTRALYVLNRSWNQCTSDFSS